MKRLLNLSVTTCISVLVGCQGDFCPAVFIPIYEVNVFDNATGKLLCQEQPGLGSVKGKCVVTYVHHTNRTGNTADISVSLDGYIAQTKWAVPNQSNQHSCFDQPSYTTKVEYFLIPQN
jgi:hypothetical protein